MSERPLISLKIRATRPRHLKIYPMKNTPLESRPMLSGSQSSLWLLSLFLVLFSSAPRSWGQTVLTVGNTEKQTTRYGLDYERLWFWNGSNSNKRQVAQWSMVDCDVDWIRVAMNSEFELDEGTYDLRAYTNKIIPMMTEMKNAKADIEFFASPRPLNEAVSNARWQPYPLWVTDISPTEEDPPSYTSGSFDFGDIKCAEYLIRYLRLMKSYGFKISYMDLTNEWQANSGGRITQNDARDIAEYMKDYVQNRPNPDPTDIFDADLVASLPTGNLPTLVPDDMPLLVGPSSWEFSQGESWIRNLNTTAKRNAIDIASSHNTNRDSGSGTEQEFADQARETLGNDVEIWNTELHGWKSTSNTDEVTSSHFMFDAIRAGFTGINGWLAIGTPNQGHSYILNQSGTVTRNVKFFIFQKLTNTSNNGRALDVTLPSNLKSSAAFIKDDLVTVWTVNDSNSDVPIQVNLGSFTNPSGQVLATRWSEAINVAGEGSTISSPPGSNSFSATVVANSVHCFEIPLVDLLPAHQFEANAVADSSSIVTLTSGGDDSGLTFSAVSAPSHGVLSGAAPDIIYTPEPGFVGTDSFDFVYSNGSATSFISTVTVSIIAKELVANWRLDESRGSTLLDATGHGHNGTIDTATRVSNGRLGGALQFNGGSQKATLPASAFDGISSALTLSMWVFGDTTQPRSDTLFRAVNDDDNRLLNIHLPWSNSDVYWEVGDVTGRNTLRKTASPDQFRGQWNLWTFNKDANGTMSAYVNGQLFDSTNTSRNLPEITEVVLGSDGGDGGYDGLVDDVRLYNYALDADETLALYNSYTGNQPPTAANMNISLVQGRETAIALEGSDPEGASLVYTIMSSPQNGTLVGAAGNMTYTPNFNFSGVDTFTYQVSDTFAESSVATVTINVTPGLVLGYWPLDEDSGNVLQDISGNGYNGTLISGARGNGVRDGALSFNGGSNRATLPAAPFQSLTNEVTISIWLKGGDSLPGIETVAFYGSGGSNSSGSRIINAHVPWNNSQVFWDASDRVSSPAEDITIDEIRGQWNHWIFTKNANLGEMNIFLNGELFLAATGKTAPIETINSFTLGSQGSIRAYDGEIDDVILFNYALSAEQVSALYDSYANDLEYTEWLDSFGTTVDNSFNNDPDGDGMPTGIEYVLDTDPTIHDAEHAPTLSGTGSNSAFSYRRKEDGTAFSTNQIVQVSDNLSDWHDMWVDAPSFPNSVTISPLADRYEEVSVTPTQAFFDAEGMDPNERLFFRLKVDF